MIEVKNLKKTYVTKGTTTHALDDVSIKFPEKGMVFLLGKSGSGKSTLLNSIGGLDTVDSGEIIIMGRSSSTFSGSDFDSYRNTFIGFIFQEYNILNEFSVEENIALALELQGKKSNKERVHKLLEEVDLKGFEKRKPNTLSGGQKQRIAIARALIKEPKIIMADEPTGALDSKTGKQVLDTLKKLSKEKLIIIVSHDREFAEIYGDRIIELKDGKIISDEQKTHIDPKNLNDNVSIIGENTLSIKDAKSLSAEDKGEILKFIEQANDKIIIATNNNDISSFKKANRISDDDKTEIFKNTEDIPIKEYSEKERKFIKSKLPLSKATKMGLSSLKVKPFRLVITMLLTIISFTLFGVSSSLMNYNSREVTKNSFNKSDYNSLKINNYYHYKQYYYQNDKLEDTYDSENQIVFNENDVLRLNQKYGNDTLALYATGEYYSSSISIANIEVSQNTPKTLRDYSIGGFATPNENSKYTNMLYGSLPQNDNEIAISNFYAYIIVNSKFKDPDTDIEININNINDLINNYIKISFNGSSNGSITYKIVGIYNTDDLDKKYQNYYNYDEVNRWDSNKIDEFNHFVKETPLRTFFITKQAYKNILEKTNYNPKNSFDNTSYFDNSKYFSIKNGDQEIAWFNYIKKKSEATLPINYFDGYNQNIEGIILPIDEYSRILQNIGYNANDFDWSTINDNEMKQKLHDFYYQARERQLEIAYSNSTNEEKDFFDNNLLAYYNYQTEINYYNNIHDYDSVNNVTSTTDYQNAEAKYYNYNSQYNDFLSSDSLNNDREYIYNIRFANFYSNIYNHNSSPYFLDELYDFINTDEGILASELYLKIFEYDTYVNIKIRDYTNNTEYNLSRRIIGVYRKASQNGNYGIYIDNSDYETFRSTNYYKNETNYQFEESEAYYMSLFVPIKNSKVFNDLKVINDNDTFIKADNSLYDTINSITELVEVLKDVFFYTAIVLAVFAALLLFNFITVSISSKAHEIGVLRAIGARGKDVFKIFFSESLFIALLAFIIAVISAFIIVMVLNNNLSNELKIPLVLLSFGPLSVALMLGIALAVALVGTFIPVLHISRKKPVDSLRSQ